mgnify:CR=1 FL=1
MFYPIHTMPIYKKDGEKHPLAEKMSLRGMSLPSYPGLNKDDVKEIINTLIQYANS